MKRIFYCKSLKKTNKPIIVRDMDNNTEYTTDEVVMKNVDIRMVFNNAQGREKRSGASTILEVTEH